MTAQHPPARKTIVALHGAGMTGAVFGGMVPHLLDFSFRALTFPGHDARAGGALIADIAGMGAWVREKIQDEAQGSVILMGHSMGALVALAAAAAPAVYALVLMGGAAKMPVNAALLATARNTPSEAMGMVAKWGIDAAHPQAGAVRTVLSSIMAQTEPAAIANDLAACDSFQDGGALALGLACPALVLAGMHDKMVPPASASALAEMIPQGDYRVLKDCGHMIMLERPVIAANEIKAFASSFAA